MSHPHLAPKVVGVHVNPQHGFSKTAKSAIRLIKNFGVEGDAHVGTTDRHRYHIRRFGQQPNLRQVHLIQSELFDELQMKVHVVCPGELGENITTLGVNLLELPVGTRLHLGHEAVVELTGLFNPCIQIENFQPGLLRHLVEKKQSGLVRKAGVMGIVIQGGVVRSDDAIRIELPPLPHRPLIYRVPVLVLRVTSIRREAENIHSVELQALDNGALPAFTPGAHIDLFLAPDLTMDSIKVLRLSFADVDSMNLELSARAKERLQDAFRSVHADAILDFIARLHREVATIVVHCEGGYSPSCAIALGLHRLYGYETDTRLLAAANPSIVHLLTTFQRAQARNHKSSK